MTGRRVGGCLGGRVGVWVGGWVGWWVGVWVGGCWLEGSCRDKPCWDTHPPTHPLQHGASGTAVPPETLSLADRYVVTRPAGIIDPRRDDSLVPGTANIAYTLQCVR